MKGLSVLENCSSRLLASSMLINGADSVKIRERGEDPEYNTGQSVFCGKLTTHEHSGTLHL